MIRSFMPLDFVDLLVAGKALSNKAKTREDIGRKDARLGDLANIVGDWFNPRLRLSAWVYTEGLALKGLASARDRSSSRAWDVNRLLVAEQDHRSCLKLLEHVSSAGGQKEIGRIFLRLSADSPLLKAADETGFLSYSTEHLYCRENTDGALVGAEGASALLPRRRKTDDDYQLFELYLKYASPQARRAEGTTYKEWQANRHRNPGQEWVFEKDGGLVGWAATNVGRYCGLMDVPAATRDDMESIVDYCLASLRSCRQTYCLVPESDATLLRLLEERGFSRVMTYSALMKELLVRVVEPYVMPAVPA